jgi:hypothetical protein
VDQGDDDLFDDNIDVVVEDKSGTEKANRDIDVDIGPDILDDDHLNLVPTEQDKLKYNFKAFNPTIYMNAPVFKLGMKFCDVKELRKALTAYSVSTRYKVKKTRNEAGRLEACCRDGCPWKLKASTDSRTYCMIIKTYNDKHTCNKVWDLKALTAPFLTERFIEEFRDNPNMSLKAFGRKVQK